MLEVTDSSKVANARLDAGGEWALAFEARRQLKFNIVASGSCWIAVDGRLPQRLEAGDAFVLAGAPAFTIGSDVGLPAMDGTAMFDDAPDREVRVGGDMVTLLGMSVPLDEVDTGLIRTELPAFMRVRAVDRSADHFRAIRALLADEFACTRRYATVTRPALMSILLVLAMRTCDLSQLERRESSGDEIICRALDIVRLDITRRWTLDALAAAVGYSRSTFAARFTRAVGASPMAYLRRQRLFAARDALGSGQKVAYVAEVFGFSSESAFRFAFKQAFGVTPSSSRLSSELRRDTRWQSKAPARGAASWDSRR